MTREPDQPTPRAPEPEVRLREQVRNALRKERELDAALAALSDRLAKIAEWHRLNVDEHGGNTGTCNECGYAWPCPTYQWATDDMAEPNCTWDLSECESHNHAAPEPTAPDDLQRDIEQAARRAIDDWYASTSEFYAGRQGEDAWRDGLARYVRARVMEVLRQRGVIL